LILLILLRYVTRLRYCVATRCVRYTCTARYATLRSYHHLFVIPFYTGSAPALFCVHVFVYPRLPAPLRSGSFVPQLRTCCARFCGLVPFVVCRCCTRFAPLRVTVCLLRTVYRLALLVCLLFTFVGAVYRSFTFCTPHVSRCSFCVRVCCARFAGFVALLHAAG